MFKTLLKQSNAHDDSVWSVTWAKNDKHEYIVSGSVDNTVKSWYWDGTKLDCRHKMEGHRLGVVSVDVDVTGSLAVSSSLDSRIMVWDLETGKATKTIDAGPANTWTVAISPDSRFVATGSNAGDINLFSLESSQDEPSMIKTRGKFIMSVAYSSDGQRVACGSMDGNVYIFDLGTGNLVKKIENAHSGSIRSMAFSPDGQTLLTGGDDGLVKMFDPARGQLNGTATGHASWVLSVAFSADGERFATGSSDCSVKVWETATKQCQHTFTDHTDQVWSVSFDRSGTKLVSASDDKSLCIYECP